MENLSHVYPLITEHDARRKETRANRQWVFH